MLAKYFKNNNITIRLDADEIKEIKNEASRNAFNYMFSVEGLVFEYIYNNIELNFIAADDLLTSAGNYDCYFNVYDAYTQKEYFILGRDLRNLLNGGALRLYAHDITDEERAANYGF